MSTTTTPPATPAQIKAEIVALQNTTNAAFALVKSTNATTGTALDAVVANYTSSVNKILGDIDKLSAAPPPIPVIVESPSTVLLLDTKGVIYDHNLVPITLVASVNNGLQLAFKGVVDTVTANVKLAFNFNHNIIQCNTANNWYTNASGNWTQLNGDPRVTPPIIISPDAYTISEGRIKNKGVVYAPNGINIFDTDIYRITPAMIRENFAAVDFIRFCVGADGAGFYSAQPDDAIINWVTIAATQFNFVVEVQNHITGQRQALMGDELILQSAWNTRMANRLKGNPKLWMGTANEVNNQVSADHLASYLAMRATGFNNIILMCTPNGNPQPPDNASVYHNMFNVAWDMHNYNWIFFDNGTPDTNQDSVNNKLIKYFDALQAFTFSADDKIPVGCFENGDIDYRGNGSDSVDAKGLYGTDQAAISGMTIARKNYAGHAQFTYDNPWNLISSLVDKTSGQLSRYGQLVAQYTALTP